MRLREGDRCRDKWTVGVGKLDAGEMPRDGGLRRNRKGEYGDWNLRAQAPAVHGKEGEGV